MTTTNTQSTPDCLPVCTARFYRPVCTGDFKGMRLWCLPFYSDPSHMPYSRVTAHPEVKKSKKKRWLSHMNMISQAEKNSLKIQEIKEAATIQFFPTQLEDWPHWHVTNSIVILYTQTLSTEYLQCTRYHWAQSLKKKWSLGLSTYLTQRKFKKKNDFWLSTSSWEPGVFLGIYYTLSLPLSSLRVTTVLWFTLDANLTLLKRNSLHLHLWHEGSSTYTSFIKEVYMPLKSFLSPGQKSNSSFPSDTSHHCLHSCLLLVYLSIPFWSTCHKTIEF